MIIQFSPERGDASLTLSKAGDVLIVNGLELDLTQLPEGGALPAEAIQCEWVQQHSMVERIDGEVHITLILPHGPNPSDAVAFPKPLQVTEDGPVELPQ